MTREMILRDKNRPSVIMYSLFNEPASNREEFRTILKEAKEEAKKTLSETLDEIHKRFPDKPIIVTEFGAGAIAGVHKHPPEMWSEEYQAELIKTYWKVFLSKDYVAGGHIWNFADFRVGQSPGRTTLNRKGIFTRTRDPKLSVRVVKELFENTPTYRRASEKTS